jgi:hypothetical protein
LVGDFSVAYAHESSTTAKTVARDLGPAGRAIMVLRDPVARAYSDYRSLLPHYAGSGGASLSTVIRQSVEALKKCAILEQPTPEQVAAAYYSCRSSVDRPHDIVKAGLYYPQVIRWLGAMKGRLLIVTSEMLKADPRRVLGEVERFLELCAPAGGVWRDLPRAVNVGRAGPVPARLDWDNATKELLRRFYQPFNAALSELSHGEVYFDWQ